ncbi:MAG: DUF1819 family protein [bacterium]|nr:DUF1819 family protein [bacterium]
MTDHAGMTEVREIHTRLCRVSLAVDDARVYWLHARPGTPGAELAEQAFAERWFGSKRMPRILLLLRTFAERFDAYPPAFEVLHRWCPDDPATRRNLCHWHTQLTDPLYRRFTSDLLPGRRARRDATVDRDVIARWLDRLTAGRWAPSTNLRLADGLLAAATEAGLCAPGFGQRPLKTPRVTDEALTYLLYLLREVDREGGVIESPYLVSVGLGGTLLEQHLRRLEALDYRRHGGLHDFGWRYENLLAWGAGHRAQEAA